MHDALRTVVVSFARRLSGAIEKYVDRAGWTDDEYLDLLDLVEDAKSLEYGAGSAQMNVANLEFDYPSFLRWLP